MVQKLKKLLNSNFKKIKEKKDPLGYMGKLRKKVQSLIDDAENFITSVHKTNPFKESSCYIEEFNEGSEIGKRHYMKETFNSKYKKHINDVQRTLSTKKRNKKNPSEKRKNAYFSTLNRSLSKKSRSRSTSSKKISSKIYRTLDLDETILSNFKTEKLKKNLKRKKSKKKILKNKEERISNNKEMMEMKEDNKKLHDLVKMLSKEMVLLRDENRNLLKKIELLEQK